MLNILNVYFDDCIPHWHNRLQHVQFHVLVLVTHGKLLYRLNDVTREASKGELIFIPSGTQREAFNDKEILHQKYAVIFTCSPELNLPLIQKTDPQFIRVRMFDYYQERFISLHRQSIERREYYDTIQTGILLEMLGNACRELEAPPLPKRRAAHVDKLEQHITQNYRKPLVLQELAELINRSPNYTLSLFKEAVGQTPLEYQHRLRIATAMEMLQNTTLTVTFIAHHLGYYDTSYFYKMFRKYTGMSPTAYAARDRGL